MSSEFTQCGLVFLSEKKEPATRYIDIERTRSKQKKNTQSTHCLELEIFTPKATRRVRLRPFTQQTRTDTHASRFFVSSCYGETQTGGFSVHDIDLYI